MHIEPQQQQKNEVIREIGTNVQVGSHVLQATACFVTLGAKKEAPKSISCARRNTQHTRI